jgi:hypothetical protein
MAVESLSAQANSDFQDVENRVLTIEPPFETPLCVAAVSIINDMAFEDSETLNVLLTAMDVFSRVIVTQPTATIIITDDDSKHTFVPDPKYVHMIWLPSP